jgi:hypothetical protein
MTYRRLNFWFWPVLFALVLPAASYAAPETLWLYRYGPLAGARYQPLASFVDDTGNVSVVGWVEPDDTSGNRDAVLFKVDSMGNLKWHTTYANATAAAAATDTSGNIYIVCGIRGASTRGELCLLKYRPDGSREMAQVYEQVGRSFMALASIAIDSGQNVYIGGVARDSAMTVVRIVKYTPGGTQTRELTYILESDLFLNDGGFHALNNGDVYLALDVEHPTRRNDWLVVKLSSEGVVRWQRVYKDTGDGWEQLRWSDVDQKGNIYLTGNVVPRDTGTIDFCTMRMDSAGNTLWTQKYNGPESLIDVPKFLMLDSGSVYVAGWSDIGTSEVITLVKYDSLGSELWVRRYGNADTTSKLGYEGDGLALTPRFCSMDIDRSGNVYLAGSLHGRSDDGYSGLTLKYDPMGNLLWEWKFSYQPGEARPGVLVSISTSGAVYGIGLDSVEEGNLGIYVAKRRRDVGGGK